MKPQITDKYACRSGQAQITAVEITEEVEGKFERLQELLWQIFGPYIASVDMERLVILIQKYELRTIREGCETILRDRDYLRHDGVRAMHTVPWARGNMWRLEEYCEKYSHAKTQGRERKSNKGAGR